MSDDDFRKLKTKHITTYYDTIFLIGPKRNVGSIFSKFYFLKLLIDILAKGKKQAKTSKKQASPLKGVIKNHFQKYFFLYYESEGQIW